METIEGMIQKTKNAKMVLNVILRKFSDHKSYNCELVNKILFAKGFMENRFQSMLLVTIVFRTFECHRSLCLH